MTWDEQGRWNENPGIPEIRRARGYRLYDAHGNRYIDFYQNAGAAMNGHRLDGALLVFKATAARGLWAEYPTVWKGRLERQIRQLFPFVERVFTFPNLELALSALSDYFKRPVRILETPGADRESRDMEGLENLGIIRWRPFAMTQGEMRQLIEGKFGEVFIPAVPFPGNFLPVPICRIRGGSFEPLASREVPYCRSGGTSPVLEALLVKAVAQTRELVANPQPELWKQFDLPGIERTGPFLRFCMDGLEYEGFFTELLKHGILLPPPSHGVRMPAIVPGEYDPGEVAPLIDEMRRRYGNG